MPADCALCKSSNATSVCGKCKNVYYCNVECQRSDWKQHKKVCKKPSQSQSSKVESNLEPQNKELCKFFGSAKGCHHKQCRYSHANPNSLSFCRHFLSKHGCEYGQTCTFR
eukprot:541042_1